MFRQSLIFLSLLLFFGFLQAKAQLYSVQNGNVSFVSEAKLELIKASSSEMKGKLDVQRKLFAFAIKINSFQGFNSPLQREHFNENYLESDRFPDASFSGKIIEDIDFSKDGSYTVRAKGILTIHGVQQERIIKSVIKVNKGKMNLVSNFTVQLADHQIPIPKIVHEKLASEIKVEVNANMQSQ
jgi:polyisoprenoid-binding protein YceI